MNRLQYSPLVVQEMFRSLLSDRTSSNSSATSRQRLSTTTAQEPLALQELLTAQEPLAAQELLTAQEPLAAPPPKNSIRYIENDQNNRREKYDGHRWRIVCTWNIDECTNLAYHHNQLCNKHNILRRNTELPRKKRKPLVTHSSVPTTNQYNHNKMRYNNNNNDDDDDIQILEDYCKSPTIRRSMNNHIKTEMPDFRVFSVEHVNNTDLRNNIKSEPMASSSYRSTNNNDIEYLSSKTRSNGLNITELIGKNIPPLTDFEEDYLANDLMQKFSTRCSMLDAQLYLHNEAIAVVKRNYQLKMDNISPEYFYDFLYRHPKLLLHYGNWFSRCKPVPPTTGCPIDTKVWTLSMIVRGSMNSDAMNDENDG